MHLASDYIRPYKDAGGGLSHCRVRIYLPEDLHNAPVVVVAGFEHRLSWRKVAAFQSGSPIFRSLQMLLVYSDCAFQALP
jgi:hypothetical protein